MKHAYLIMAHKNKEQLKVLLSLLDDENNEFFLHIDAKSDMDFSGLTEVCKKSTLHCYKQIKIYWGDLSQVACQLFLLREAVKGNFDYYHLISGADLPLMKAGDIDAFFEKNKGKQFINFDVFGESEKENCKYVHIMQPLLARVRNKRSKLCLYLYKADEVYVRYQKKKGRRTGLSRGANWSDITHDLALDYLAHEKELLKKVKFAFSADESILQTYYMQYGKKWEVYGTGREYEESIMRKIDWNRSDGLSPYTWHLEDYDELMSCGMLFARKFDWDTDKDIILKIQETLS
ncbi:MAG: hypothetical protein K6G22_08125 [Lachnospiraceae bacterium]|nr:hypothetical protein [Lachnospiraceae bacterium]